MISPKEIVDEAATWIGTPFQHQARARGVGVDCIGVVIGVGRALGLWADDFDYKAYGREPLNGVLLREVNRHCIHIPLRNIGPGCILLMRWYKEPQHAAIFTGDDLIHAASCFGGTVRHRYDMKWQKRTVAAFQFPGVAYG